jgi:DNA-binding HxlR family transcriptional regulator
MTETRSKTARTEFGSAMMSVEAADAAFAYAAQMEAVISDLHTATRQGYGQYCGLARALEIVGERWALLVVRDLLVGPRSLVELHRGLPRVPVSVLSARLAELASSGIIQPRAAGDTTYELTEYGRGLEDVVLALGRWGVAALGTPKATDIVTADSVVMAMRAAFRPTAAGGHRVGFELRLPDFVIHAVVDDGALAVAAGPLPGADLVIEPGPALKDLVTGAVSPVQALAAGSVRVTGDPDLLTLFVQLFQV